MAAKCARSAFLSFLITFLLLLGGCKKARESATPNHGSVAEHTAPADWMGFTPYPRARQLCNESTLGFSGGRQMEIHWVSFATRDSVQAAVTFYSKAEKGTVELKEDSLTIRRGNPVAAVLSVVAASSADYPRCSEQPQPEEKTVIDVSTVTRP